jgi:hypothetical protein
MPDFRRYLEPMSSGRLSLPLLVIAVAFALAAPASAMAAPAFYDGISADGSVALFSTTEKMVPGDTDNEEDVYVRTFDSGLGEYVTREVSIGPKGGNDTLPATYDGISADGTEVFFSTREQLVPGDPDHKQDVYVRLLPENRTVLVSQGDSSCAAEECGNGETDASFAFNGVAPGGGKVFFTTTEQLNGADEDSSIDIYVRDLEAETTELVSAGDSSCTVGGCGNGSNGVSFRGTDRAGDKAYFTTVEILSSEDSDAEESDIYERDLSTGRTYLVSVPGVCPTGLPVGQNCEPSFGGASPDGSRIFFETNERIPAGGEDTDSSQDVYGWSGGTPALESIGPDGGNGESIVTYAGTNGDGGIAYFQTSEKLDATADTDSAQDVYQRSGGLTSLVSAGESGKGNGGALASFSWASTAESPQVAVFRTGEALTSEDEDSSQDVYARVGEVTSLVSIGPEGGNGESDASWAGASEDGSKLFFVTSESLVAQDADESSDIYLRSGGVTTLVSGGQINGNGEYPAALHGVSADGSKAFFVTQERLTEGDDFAGQQDVYSWSGSGTLLVSVKNSSELVLGPPPPTLEGTNPASPNSSTTPAIFGQAEEGALIKIYKTTTCSGEPVAQGTAGELASPGLTVTVPLGSTMTFRATAEAEGVVSACSNGVSYTQQNPPPPPPPAEEEGGGGSGGGGEVSGGTGPSGGSGGSTGGGSHNGIAYVTPLPKITFGPAAKTRLRRPTFRFLDATGQPGTKFFCRVDKKKWSACTSPIKLKKLKLGRHVFSLKAVNAVDKPSATAVKRAIKVVG